MIFFAQLANGQNLTISEIDSFTKIIDKHKAENKLIKVFYPNMSACGGGVDGYYQNGDLVLIDSKYQAELGYSSRIVYLKNNVILKIIYREYFAEWGKYAKNYPSDKYEWNPSKMTYTDTLYTIKFSTPTNYVKSSKQKIISKKPNQDLIKNLVSCGHEMKKELQEVISQIDSLRFVTEMPYICENGICGDELFWKAVELRQSAIELLIDKLEDTTMTKANVVNFGRNYTVSDIAFVVLKEIIHDIPTFELLGVDFDKNGCGYCSYWNHLNKDYKNRQKFKLAVKNWYFQNKDKFVWVKSNDFTSCDCSGKHPNEGHYELKK